MAKAQPYTAYDGYRDFKRLYDLWSRARSAASGVGAKRARPYTIPAPPVRPLPPMARKKSGAWNRLQAAVQRAAKAGGRRPYKGTRGAHRFRRILSSKHKNKYHSTGRMGRRFKRPRKFGASKFQTRGVVVHMEGGGVVNSGTTQVLYMGHAIPIRQTFRCICKYLTKLMWRKHGRAITSFYDTVQEANVVHIVPAGAIKYRYMVTEGGPVQTASFNVVQNWTFETVSENLFSVLNALIGGGTSYMEFLSLVFVPNLTDDIGLNLQIDLTNLQLELDCSCKLALQNRTLASTGTADESSMLDIANNPIGGKCYAGRGPGPQPKWRNNVAAADCVSPFCDQITGIIDWDVDQVNFTADMTSQYSRPPPGGAFQFCGRVAPSFLKPGEIKNSIVTYKKKIWFNKFVSEYITQAQVGAAVPVGNSFGYYKMYGFEKKVNTTVEEPVISVGYEHNMTYRCCGSFRKRITIPLQLKV